MFTEAVRRSGEASPQRRVGFPRNQRLGDGRGAGAHGRRDGAGLRSRAASPLATGRADLHFDHFLSLRRFEMTEARGTPVGDMEAALLTSLV